MGHVEIVIDWQDLLGAFRDAARTVAAHVEMWAEDALHFVFNEYAGLCLDIEAGLGLSGDRDLAHSYATAWGM